MPLFFPPTRSPPPLLFPLNESAHAVVAHGAFDEAEEACVVRVAVFI